MWRLIQLIQSLRATGSWALWVLRWRSRPLVFEKWGVSNASLGGFVGQVIRIIGAATKTAMGLVPERNTGGLNVNQFKRMAVPGDLAAIVEQAER